MNKPDQVIVTADQNPAFFEVLKDKKPGDKGECELQYSVKEVGTESAVLTAEAWVPEGYEVAEGEETGPEVPQNNPGDAMMTPTASLVRKKAKG